MNPRLTLMHSQEFRLDCAGVIEDIPEEMLLKSVEGFGGFINPIGHYPISAGLENFLRDKITKIYHNIYNSEFN